jgi:hypothetical protein
MFAFRQFVPRQWAIEPSRERHYAWEIQLPQATSDLIVRHTIRAEALVRPDISVGEHSIGQYSPILL